MLTLKEPDRDIQILHPPTHGFITVSEIALDLAHFDLLHEARRIWKKRLPDCKLQTLEQYICKRIRYGDIPGDRIADAYHAYVRTGNARQVATILKHNMLDLITLGDLLTHLPPVF